LALDVFAVAFYASFFWSGLDIVLLLGSTSPRRAQLLAQIGLDFDIAAPDVDETILSGESAEDYVKRMSDFKFSSVHAGLIAAQDQLDEPVLLTADTVVVIDSEVLGKPQSEAHAADMLRRLSGQEHQSVTVGRNTCDNQQFLVETIVEFRRLTTSEIYSYWLTGEPNDKAGGYGIQGIGAIFVQALKGSYSNVVGLPLTETSAVLADFGIAVLSSKTPNGLERSKELSVKTASSKTQIKGV
jgi:septum formation protein